MVVMASSISPIQCGKKRKQEPEMPEFQNKDINNSAKRCKRDPKKVKSTREQERVLLENFVKYGILPGSPDGNAKHESIPISIPSPISPIRTPARPITSSPISEDQRVPDPDITIQKHPSQRASASAHYWRPWLSANTGVKFSGKAENTQQKNASNCVNKPAQRRQHANRMTARHFNKRAIQQHQQQLQLVPNNLPREHLIHPGQNVCANMNGQNFRMSPAPMQFYPTDQRNIHRPVRAEAFPRCENKLKFTPTVKTWDTSSPEFLKSFKQPVKLMWPRSKAFDYKYQDAQDLLQAFPVQAAIGFYDDSDDQEYDRMLVAKHNNHIAHQRHLAATNMTMRCAPVLN